MMTNELLDQAIQEVEVLNVAIKGLRKDLLKLEKHATVKLITSGPDSGYSYLVWQDNGLKRQHDAVTKLVRKMAQNRDDLKKNIKTTQTATKNLKNLLNYC